jgi:leader peptidase (prepilin peptidase)/N-methyltransferase
MFDLERWAALPFHFWTVTLFVFGCIVGSFLNVCVHRMPLGLSVAHPPSHCPHCKYSIPWWLNVPLFTWLWLRGRCKNCGAPIAARYFLVELLTGLLFAGVWVRFGAFSPLVALIYCLFIAGLIVATFIDFEHFIIPDEITIGGMFAGFALSFAVPKLHIAWPSLVRCATSMSAAQQSFFGLAVGGGVVYAIVRLGKLLFGKYKISLPSEGKVIFTETSVKLPEEEVPYEEIFYRSTDYILAKGRRIQLPDRCYMEAVVRLSPKELKVGDDVFNPEEVKEVEFQASELTMPREAMGFGDVKFMAAIGAFLGWPSVIFILTASSVIGAVVGISLILIQKKDKSTRIPYGPYIALAALLWLFGGDSLAMRWFQF